MRSPSKRGSSTRRLALIAVVLSAADFVSVVILYRVAADDVCTTAAGRSPVQVIELVQHGSAVRRPQKDDTSGPGARKDNAKTAAATGDSPSDDECQDDFGGGGGAASDGSGPDEPAYTIYTTVVRPPGQAEGPGTAPPGMSTLELPTSVIAETTDCREWRYCGGTLLKAAKSLFKVNTMFLETFDFDFDFEGFRK